MLILRSLAYNVVFYVSLIGQMIFWTPFYFLAPRRLAWYVPKFWARSNLWLLEKIAGTRFELTGQENLPEGSYILAPKHQSFLDAFAFVPWVPDALYILKRELMWIPVFGWYVGRMKMVPVKRGDRSRALKDVVAKTTERMVEGRQLLIYPEGTRRAPGEKPNYKYGIVELYARLGVPVVPVAHMAGLWWPRRKFLRHPGLVKAKILPAIPAGLPRDEFMARLIADTEAQCDAFLLEAADGPNPPPFPPTARARLAELRVEKPSA
ncbi:MAG: 1-acyl-sn-glycerol-3-phosphate acyltransferase [Rhizobiaceae bacterium]